MSSDLLKARLVYDGGDTVHIPPELGVPRADQMQGTPAEQLSELAGRVCYDSLGKGRPSFTVDCGPCHGTGYFQGPRLGDEPCPECKGKGHLEGYHDHILSVGHGSVLEHFNFTVEIPLGVSGRLKNDVCFVDTRQALLAWQCANRPGVIVLSAESPRGLRVTVNLRSVTEWLRWEQELYGRVSPMAVQLASMFHRIGHAVAPHIVPENPLVDCEVVGRSESASLVICDELDLAVLANPICDHERWVSLFMAGSRGFSHEQVRHGDFSAISQRSTRYVDESESPWVEHPLLAMWLASDDPADIYLLGVDHLSDAAEHLAIEEGSGSWRAFVKLFRDGGCEGGVINDCRMLYDAIVMGLERWLVGRGVDKGTARKQARGAGRGYLGNALLTEMVFSASVAQWKRMLRQRASVHADAEIRAIYASELAAVLSELKASRYGESFAAFHLEPSPDGIGMVAVERSVTEPVPA